MKFKINLEYVFLIIIIVAYLFIILSLHSCSNSNFRCITPNLTSYFYITDQLEIELIGAGVVTLTFSYLLYKIQNKIEQNKYKAEVRKKYTATIKDLKSTFLKEKCQLNISSGINSKAYFDNSHINKIYDVIAPNTQIIKEYIQQFPKDITAEILIKFYEDVEKGYILGEKLDTLLFKMIKEVQNEDYRIKNDLIFIKAEYANFPKSETILFLKTISGLNDYSENDENFVKRSYKNPSSNQRKGFKDKFDVYDKEMRETIKNIKKTTAKILNSVKGN